MIFVDDGSRDYSATIVEHARLKYHNLKLVQFSRNFGHQIAITAGIRYASGDTIVVMDADLQDPPEVIPAMIKQWQAGYQVVYGKRLQRDGETWFKKISAHWFYRILAKLTTIQIPIDTGDFRLIDRQVAETLKKVNEDDPYVRGLVSWVGFQQTAVEYERHERLASKSKYPFKKMIKLAFDGITSFSAVPLKFATWLSAILISFGILLGLISLIVGQATNITLLVFMMCLCSGVILLTIGILGVYLSRIFAASRQRPLYIVANTVGFNKTAAITWHHSTHNEIRKRG